MLAQKSITLTACIDGDGVRIEKVRREVLPNRMFTREIIPPEPHSTQPDLRIAWAHAPRWLQVVLFLMFIAAGVLILTYVKG